jgi:MFS family permease
VAHWAGQFSAISLLRADGVLADDAAEQLVRAAGDHLADVLLLGGGLLLAGLHQHVVAVSSSKREGRANDGSMFIARFFLGFGIGPKSATVPIYAAESTPPAIRGALVMQWQASVCLGGI